MKFCGSRAKVAPRHFLALILPQKEMFIGVEGRGWILMSFWITMGEDGTSSSRSLRATLKWCSGTLVFSWIAYKFTDELAQMNNPSPADVNLTGSVNSSFTKVYHMYCSKRLETLKC